MVPADDGIIHHSRATAIDGVRVYEEWKEWIRLMRAEPDETTQEAMIRDRYLRDVDLIGFELTALQAVHDHICGLISLIHSDYEKATGAKLVMVSKTTRGSHDH